MRLTVIPVLLILSTFFYQPTTAFAQTETGLCPPGFDEGVVTTGFVDCYRQSSQRSDREDAEFLRLEREAVCIAEPNSELISSEIIQASNGNFFARLICRIYRDVPSGTVLCPEGSEEVFRAFDSLVCRYFGSAANNMSAATAALDADASACEAAEPGGTVLDASIRFGTSADDEPFYYHDLACGFTIPVTDIFECPVGFEEEFRDDEMLICERFDMGIPSLAEAQTVSDNLQAICSDTTAGLGDVTRAEITADTSGTNTFFSLVECTINIPRYGEFQDGDIVRACDETCTLDLEQTRNCLNGGQIGQPGCSAPSSQIVELSCNTGTNLDSACPLLGVPSANIVPLLLIDEEDE